jgi:hypothetical protein
MEELPPEFWQGVDQFNQRQFYACHDTLEALWMEAAQPEKKFYQGILQVAVGLYHLSNKNWHGTVISIGNGLGHLQMYLPDYAGLDIESFVTSTYSLLKALQEAGSEQVSTIFTELIQTEAGINLKPEEGKLQFPILHKLPETFEP